jgi:hypothetical protein
MQPQFEQANGERLRRVGALGTNVSGELGRGGNAPSPQAAVVRRRHSGIRLGIDVFIKDAEELLAYCDSLGHPLPQNVELFKCAGSVMALTAWETYVEDRVLEEADAS